MKKTLLEIFKNCMTFAFKSVWIILIVIILFALGRNLLGRMDVKSGRDYERRSEDTSFVSRDYNLDKEILEAVEKAGQVVAIKTSAKAGSKTAARMIPCIGWGITIALCVWDIIDYTSSYLHL